MPGSVSESTRVLALLAPRNSCLGLDVTGGWAPVVVAQVGTLWTASAHRGQLISWRLFVFLFRKVLERRTQPPLLCLTGGRPGERQRFWAPCAERARWGPAAEG